MEEIPRMAWLLQITANGKTLTHIFDFEQAEEARNALDLARRIGYTAHIGLIHERPKGGW